MPKLTKRCVDAAAPRPTEYFIWDDELLGFGLRVFNSGKRSYFVQYRADGRTRRMTIGLHGVWTPDEARREARALLGGIAKGENPAEEREFDRKAIAVKEPLRALPRRRREWPRPRQKAPAQESFHACDRSWTDRPAHHSLARFSFGQGHTDRRRKQVHARCEHGIDPYYREDASPRQGYCQRWAWHGNPHHRLARGHLHYAVGLGIVASNPVRGVRRPADLVRDRRLSDDEYRTLGRILETSDQTDEHRTAIAMVRLLALTGCRRGEIINLRWDEVDEARGCFD